MRNLEADSDYGTATQTVTVTIPQSRTVQAQSTRTIQATIFTTSTLTILVPQTIDVKVTGAIPVTVTPVITTLAERAKPQEAQATTVPAYASAYSGSAGYSSACSCFGVTRGTVTASTPVSSVLDGSLACFMAR